MACIQSCAAQKAGALLGHLEANPRPLARTKCGAAVVFLKAMQLIAPLSLVVSGCASPGGQLESLARQRLELAPQIAWAKYSQDLPVYDPVRETAALQSVMAQGAARGVPAEATRRFFAAQMEASRRIQWEWIHSWRKNLAPRPAEAAPSLDTNLRPRIDAIGAQQVDALARGARPLTLDQISVLGARFWPKNALSTAAHSAPSTPAVTSQR